MTYLPKTPRLQRMEALLTASVHLQDYLTALERRPPGDPAADANLAGLRFALEHYPNHDEIMLIADVLEPVDAELAAAQPVPGVTLGEFVEQLEKSLVEIDAEVSRFFNRVVDLLGAAHHEKRL